VPLDRLEKVRGDVKIMATVEYANSGTTHQGGQRIAYTLPPRVCTIADVEGDLSAWFSRVNLNVARINGRVNVQNEAGATVLTVDDELPREAHWVVSSCGRIELHAAVSSLGDLPVMALTNDGTAKTGADRGTLDEVSFTTGAAGDGSRRNWRGFRSRRTAADTPFGLFEYFERPGRVLAGTETAPGLTLISRSGVVTVMLKP
jgi:hypothetical protein